VDFAALVRAAEDIGARTYGPVEQGTFLTRLGIEARAQTLTKHSPPAAATDIAAALRRLTKGGPRNMGSLFKVLAITHPAMDNVAAFEDHEPTVETGAS
jgi:SAM-dependent MidA family methyltransferase